MENENKHSLEVLRYEMREERVNYFSSFSSYPIIFPLESGINIATFVDSWEESESELLDEQSITELYLKYISARNTKDE